MASAEFLEEALSTKVDESAVSAIVGSLENQLGTGTATAADLTGANGIMPGQTPTSAPQQLQVLQTAVSVGVGVGVGVGKPLQIQTPLIIKQAGPGPGPVSVGQTVGAGLSRPSVVAVPMCTATIPVSLGQGQGQGAITSQAVMGGPLPPPGIQTNSVQILNLRPAAPVAVAGQKGVGVGVGVPAVQPRVVIGSPIVGARQTGPGLTLQTLPGFAGGQQAGHLLLKTENGQYQLLRVGPTAVAPQQAQSLRLTTVPAGPTATTGGMTVVAGSPLPAAATTVAQPASVPVANAPIGVGVVQQPRTAAAAVSSPAAVLAQKTSVENMKEKCRKFLSNLLDLSSKEPKAVEKNVRILIQELIDAKVEPEAFCARLEKLLDASPQPCLIGFLKKTLPILRRSLANGELTIEGIHPPPPGVACANSQSPPSPGSSPGPTLTTLKPVANPAATTTTASPKSAVPNARNAAKPAVQQANRTFVRPASSIASAPSGGSGKQRDRDRKSAFSFADDRMAGDDDINDVAAMGGINLAEESQKILRSTEMIGTQIRSVKDEHLAAIGPLQARLKRIAADHGLEEPPFEVASLISHATQERLKSVVERLACIAEHRMDAIKTRSDYEVTRDTKGQLKFLEDLDRVERKRREENEREILLRAAKSRSKTEDPEQAKLKEKAKEMQRAEMEELRQREANMTALQAIGPRKRPKMSGRPDSTAASDAAASDSTSSKNGIGRSTAPPRARTKRVNYRDLLFLLEQERDTVRSQLLYKCYLK